MNTVREGDFLAGKYRVERVLGQGGMGMVVAARHVALDERVAMKFLLPEMLGDHQAVARFLREARAAARIKNEHVVRVSDVGELEDGAPYMVMEYLGGQDLAALLEARGVLSVEEAVDYVAQTCEAIAGAHALGIIHRDLKPSNLMLIAKSDGSPFIKVLDFGISKVAAADASAAMTRTRSMLGSPLYMSPEQMTSARDVDARSDIWSLGTILYELLTGMPPFTADSLPGVAVKIATTPHRPMRELRPEIPPELDSIVSRCLAKQPDARFANVAELAAALSPFAPEHARSSIRGSARILGVPDPTGALPERPQSTRRWGLVALVVGCIAAAAGALALSQRHAAEPAREVPVLAPQPPSVAASPSPSPSANPSRDAPSARSDEVSVAATVQSIDVPPQPSAALPVPRKIAPKPKRPAHRDEPSAKTPESAYEHM